MGFFNVTDNYLMDVFNSDFFISAGLPDDIAEFIAKNGFIDSIGDGLAMPYHIAEYSTASEICLQEEDEMKNEAAYTERKANQQRNRVRTEKNKRRLESRLKKCLLEETWDEIEKFPHKYRPQEHLVGQTLLLLDTGFKRDSEFIGRVFECLWVSELCAIVKTPHGEHPVLFKNCEIYSGPLNA